MITRVSKIIVPVNVACDDTYCNECLALGMH
jgi:hypothetical protein